MHLRGHCSQLQPGAVNPTRYQKLAPTAPRQLQWLRASFAGSGVCSNAKGRASSTDGVADAEDAGEEGPGSSSEPCGPTEPRR